MSKRTGIYCRVSTLDQSNEIQRMELEEFAERRGWSIEGVFEDKASGTSEKRPELQVLIKASRERKIDVVLISQVRHLIFKQTFRLAAVVGFADAALLI